MENRKHSLMQKAIAIAMLIVFTSLSAFATPTSLTPVTVKLNNYAVLAGDLTVSFVAMDAVNGNSFAATGQEIVIFNNTDVSSHTITINSVADQIGRTDTSLTSYSIAASGFAVIQMKFLPGWVSGGLITMNTNSALVKVAVIRWQ